MENNENTQILDQLKEKFNSEDFEAAIELIKSNKDSFEPGIYEYNLAIAYMKNNQFVEARVSLEEAKSNGFYSNELESALSEVKKSLEVYRLEESQNFNDTFTNVVTTVPIDLYITISLVFFVVFGVFFKKMDRYIKVVILILAFMPISFYGLFVKDYRSVVILEDQIVYSGPSQMFEQIQLIPKGMKLITGKTHNGWRYILSPSSHRGWVITDKVKKL